MKRNVLFISSTGGHLDELMQLSPLFKKYDYHIITEETRSNLKLKDKYKDKLGAIVIDYLGLINNNSKLAQQSRNLQVGEMCHALKGLAKELQIPVITLSQLARPPKKNLGNDKPMMNELKDSGDIEADADIIMLLHRQDYWTGQQGAQENAENSNQNENGENNPTSKTELIISKNRNFKTGQVFFIFSKDKQRFDSYSEEEGI